MPAEKKETFSSSSSKSKTDFFAVVPVLITADVVVSVFGVVFSAVDAVGVDTGGTLAADDFAVADCVVVLTPSRNKSESFAFVGVKRSPSESSKSEVFVGLLVIEVVRVAEVFIVDCVTVVVEVDSFLEETEPFREDDFF